VGSCEKLLLLSPMLVPISWSPLSAIAETPWYRIVVFCPCRWAPNMVVDFGRHFANRCAFDVHKFVLGKPVESADV